MSGPTTPEPQGGEWTPPDAALLKPGKKARATQAAAPPLGVAHLFLWTAGVAVYLGLNPDWYQESLSPLGIALLTVVAIPRGLAVAGLMLFVYRRCRGFKCIIEPGEWLLAVVGLWLILESLLMGRLSQLFQSPMALLDSLTCLAVIAPLFSNSLQARWKQFFLILFGLQLFPLLISVYAGWSKPSTTVLHDALGFLIPANYWIAGALFLMASARDRAEGVRHGWLHWVGFATAAIIVATGMLVPFLL